MTNNDDPKAALKADIWRTLQDMSNGWPDARTIPEWLELVDSDEAFGRLWASLDFLQEAFYGDSRIEKLPNYLGPVFALATRLHVSILVIALEDAANEWTLMGFSRYHGSRRGAGATVLRELHTLADQHCIKIRLCAGGVKLIRYYEQFGYVACQGNDMVRLPRSAWPRKVSIGS